MQTFKPYYGPGEAILTLQPGDYRTSPFRMFRGGMLGGGVSIALYNALMLIEVWHSQAFMKGLKLFVDCCQRKWEFQASIADRFTNPGAVFLN